MAYLNNRQVTREFIRHTKCKTELLEIGDVFFCPGHDCRRDVEADETEVVKAYEMPRLPPPSEYGWS